MDLHRSRLLEHPDQVRHGGSPDNGIIHQHDALSPDHRSEHAQLLPHAGLPLLLGGLDKGPPHIAVFIKGQLKRKTRLRRVAPGRRKPGFRHPCHQISLRRAGSGQDPSGPQPGVIDPQPVDGAVQPGKINIFKHTVGMRPLMPLLKLLIGVNLVSRHSDNLSRLHIPQKFRSHGGKSAAL